MSVIHLSAEVKKKLSTSFFGNSPKAVGYSENKNAIKLLTNKNGINTQEDVYKVILYTMKAAADNPLWLNFFLLVTQELYLCQQQNNRTKIFGEGI